MKVHMKANGWNNVRNSASSRYSYLGTSRRMKQDSTLTWRIELRHDADAPEPSVLDHVGHVLHRVHVLLGVGAQAAAGNALSFCDLLTLFTTSILVVTTKQNFMLIPHVDK